MSVDLKKLESVNKLVLEVQELVGTWEFWIEGLSVNPIEVKVWRDSIGMYTGLTNYLIKNPNQASAYRSTNPAPTVQDAIIMAIGGFLAYFKPELVSNTEFTKADDVRF
jgi:hypothetical protein